MKTIFELRHATIIDGVMCQDYNSLGFFANAESLYDFLSLQRKFAVKFQHENNIDRKFVINQIENIEENGSYWKQLTQLPLDNANKEEEDHSFYDLIGYKPDPKEDLCHHTFFVLKRNLYEDAEEHPLY